MKNQMTFLDFMNKFPNDEACLSHIMKTLYPDNLIRCTKCQKQTKFYKLKNILAYSCGHCGHHIHPMVQTPFYRSHTPLQKWFYAIWLFTTSKNGVSAKEIQRQTGVTYKTAWRMCNKIRGYMAFLNNHSRMEGHIEMDETFIGGVQKGKSGRNVNGKKAVIFGIVKRGGDLVACHVPNAKKRTLFPIISRYVSTNCTVSTDEYVVYKKLWKLHITKHGTSNHRHGQFVNGIHHTNTIDGFWSILKRSIKGTYVHVSKKHMDGYLGEMVFRFNWRKKSSGEMFGRLVDGFWG